MKITILTLFPEVIDKYIDTSIIKKARQKKIIEVNVVNFRKFSKEKNQKVDDYQFGGGPGMVLMIDPIVSAINFYKTSNSKVILLTPSGKKFNNKIASNLSEFEEIILICGHYEGFDERIINYVDYQISIGDYILTGGELPALVILDSISRLIPNVINKNSLLDETFNNNLLDYPVYTKPIEFNGAKVPEVLLSGNHNEINKFRKFSQIEKTKKNRIDLYKKYISKNKEQRNE